MRRYADAEKALDRAVALNPKDAAMRASRAEVELNWHADPRPLLSTVRTIIAEDSREAENIAQFWLQLALHQRDFDGAVRALAVLPIDGCHVETIPFPSTWCQGLVAQMHGDTAPARVAFTSARNEIAKLVGEQPNYAEALCALGMADAVLRIEAKRHQCGTGERSETIFEISGPNDCGNFLRQGSRRNACISSSLGRLNRFRRRGHFGIVGQAILKSSFFRCTTR